MPAADDLLIASHAETGRVERPTGTLPEDNGDSGKQMSAWLAWLAELLTDTRALALIRVSESGAAQMLAQTPAAVHLPGAGRALACRAAARRSRQRLVLPDTDEMLLGLPLPANAGEEGFSTILLLLSGTLNKSQQSALLGLAAWAMKSARWWSDTDKPTRLPWYGRDSLAEPMTPAALINQLGAHYPGSVCALHWATVGLGGLRRSRVLSVSGQSAIDRSGTTLRSMTRHVDTLYADGPPLPLYEVQAPSPAEDAADMTEQGCADQLPWPLSFMVPVSVGGELLIVSMYWSDPELLPEKERERLQSSLIPAVQSAWLQEERSRGLVILLWRRWRLWQRRMLQGGAVRALQVGLFVVVLAALLWPVEKRLSAEVIVEAAERHALIAPLDGYIKSVQARAGDRVAKGDLLASLDDEDLLRQADKWTAEAQKNQQDYLSALAVHDRVEMSSLRENRLLIQTELEQVQAQLARHQLRAPVAGIVLSDAVEDALGSAVKAGKVLFEVGSAEQYRLALQVPERSISEVESGQLLSLRMTADPKRRSQARVETVIPVATASQGKSTFKVYASPLERDEGLRPGMKGIGKILVGRESRLMQWSSSLWARCVWLAWKLGLTA